MDILANLDYYKVFSAVASKGSMKEAAEALYVSQPAISKTIQTLEKQLGGTLFIRSNKGLILTKEGEDLLLKINKALEIIQDAEKEFQNNYKLDSGEIRIGISTVLTKILLLDKIKAFRSSYPNVKITIINGLTPVLINDLYDGKLDLVIFNDENQPYEGLNINKIAELEYGFVYNPEYITPSDNALSENTLIVQKAPSFTRKYLEKYLLENKIKVNSSIDVVSQELVREFTKIGMGIGFVYVDLIDDSLSILKTDKLTTDVFVAQNKNMTQTRAVREFMKNFV